MQCLARAVARSARAAAERYGGRSFASSSSTGSRGASAAKASYYVVRQRRAALQERLRSAHEQHLVRRMSAKLGAMEGNLDKLKVPLLVRAAIQSRSCAVISGALVAEVLFGSDSEEEILPN